MGYREVYSEDGRFIEISQDCTRLWNSVLAMSRLRVLFPQSQLICR